MQPIIILRVPRTTTTTTWQNTCGPYLCCTRSEHGNNLFVSFRWWFAHVSHSTQLLFSKRTKHNTRMFALRTTCVYMFKAFNSAHIYGTVQWTRKYLLRLFRTSTVLFLCNILSANCLSLKRNTISDTKSGERRSAAIMFIKFAVQTETILTKRIVYAENLHINNIACAAEKHTFTHTHTRNCIMLAWWLTNILDSRSAHLACGGALQRDAVVLFYVCIYIYSINRSIPYTHAAYICLCRNDRNRIRAITV